MIKLLIIALLAGASDHVYHSDQIEVEETYVLIFDDAAAKNASDLSKCVNAVPTPIVRKRLIEAVAGKRLSSVRTRVHKNFFSGPPEDGTTTVNYHFKGRPVARWCSSPDLLEIVAVN